MNEGMFIGIRNYLEEIASTSRQLLAEQQRTNELLATLVEQGKPVQVANSKPAPAPVKATEQPAPTMPTAPKPLAKKPASK